MRRVFEMDLRTYCCVQSGAAPRLSDSSVHAESTWTLTLALQRVMKDILAQLSAFTQYSRAMQGCYHQKQLNAMR